MKKGNWTKTFSVLSKRGSTTSSTLRFSFWKVCFTKTYNALTLSETPWSCCSSQAPSPCGSPRCRRRSATSCQSQEEPRTWTMREYMFCLRIFFNSIREFSSVKTKGLSFNIFLASSNRLTSQLNLKEIWLRTVDKFVKAHLIFLFSSVKMSFLFL